MTECRALPDSISSRLAIRASKEIAEITIATSKNGLMLP